MQRESISKIETPLEAGTHRWRGPRRLAGFLLARNSMRSQVRARRARVTLGILARCAVATQTNTRVAATTVSGRRGSPISSHDQTTDNRKRSDKAPRDHLAAWHRLRQPAALRIGRCGEDKCGKEVSAGRSLRLSRRRVICD